MVSSLLRRRGRFASACLLVSGIGLATLTDRLPSRPVIHAGPWILLSGDFHVHGFPGDGALAPWALRDEARRAGLDVIAVTNHNQAFTGQIARAIANGPTDPLVLAGEEVTNPEYHLIAIGIDKVVKADQPALQAIADVHAAHGVAIAAHPTPIFRGYADDATVAALDGSEAAHPVFEPADTTDFVQFFARARRLNPHVAAIGSSDFHVSPELGLCRTFLFVRGRSEAEVLDAIRAGRTVAMDEFGALTGDPELIGLLRHTTIINRVDGHPSVRRLTLVLAWIGLLGLLVL
jgi:hypothetical protein